MIPDDVELPVFGGRDDPPEWVIDVFGLDPREVGNRYRDWGVYNEVGWAERHLSLEDYGCYLAVCGRDGAANPPDLTAGVYPNYVGTTQGVDRTYRYYYYAPLKEIDNAD